MSKRGVLEEIAHADGGDQHREAGRRAQGLIGEPLDDDAKHRADDDGQQHRHDVGQSQIEHRAERYVTADHDDVAVGKVQHLGNAVDHGIAEGDDRVHAAEADAADEIGQKFHRMAPLFSLLGSGLSVAETRAEARAPAFVSAIEAGRRPPGAYAPDDPPLRKAFRGLSCVWGNQPSTYWPSLTT